MIRKHPEESEPMKRVTTEGLEDEASESAAFSLPRPSKTLTALTTSALALPGIAGSARADAPIERASASGSFSYYKEDNLSPRKFEGTGDRERYEVFTKQLRFDLPVSERIDIGVDYLYEQMSGASPWYVKADPGTGDRLQVMSGATIEDERHDLLIDTDFYLDRGKDTFSVGFSKEKDYASVNLGIAAERHLNDKNTTVSIAGGFSYDWIDPTDPGFSVARPASGEKWSIDLFGGISQILSRSSTVQFTINYKHSDGYLSDPYKAITDLTFTNIFSDRRPDTKEQASFLLRYRHHFESVSGSLHTDARVYTDDWGVSSYTAELAWYQNFFEWLTIAPTVRWYSQGKADFYDTVLPAATPPKFRSSDFRLSPYGALSGRIRVDVELLDILNYNAPEMLQSLGISEGLDLIASVSYERYFSDGGFGVVSVSEVDEAPGLVRFHVFAVSLSGRF